MSDGFEGASVETISDVFTLGGIESSFTVLSVVAAVSATLILVKNYK